MRFGQSQNKVSCLRSRALAGSSRNGDTVLGAYSDIVVALHRVRPQLPYQRRLRFLLDLRRQLLQSLRYLEVQARHRHYGDVLGCFGSGGVEYNAVISSLICFRVRVCS